MVLPVTLTLHDDEAPLDFVARLAVANGFRSLREFLAHTDASARAIAEGDADALSLVSAWSAVPVAKLARLASVGNGPGGTWRMGCATFNKEMRSGRRIRVCAKCVLDDREREAGRLPARAYRRAWWSVRGIGSCHVHCCELTEWSADSDVDVNDFSIFVNSNLEAIRHAASAVVPARQPGLDRFLIERVFGTREDGFLHMLDANVAAEFSRYLGEFLAIHDLAEGTHKNATAGERGFTLAAAGEEQIRRAIAEVIDRKRPMARYVEPFLGPMVRWLRRNIDKPSYQPVIDLVQDIVERNMPFGEGQVIFKPVQSRHVYCVNSAHADFGIMHPRIRALMKANDPDFRDGFPDASTYFDAASLRSILEEARDTMTSTEAGAALGLREDQVHDLLGEGVLEQVELRSDDGRPYTRIRKTDMDQLVRRLSETMSPAVSTEDMMSLRVAAGKFSRRVAKLIAMILEGRLQAVVVPGDEPIIWRARVRADAINVSPLDGGTEELMRLRETEIALGTTTGTVNDLIERGYLRQQNRKRETGRMVRFIERRSLAEFDATYVSLSAIAKLRNGYRARIKAELEGLGIAPIFEPEGFNARFYRRSDLARIGFKA